MLEPLKLLFKENINIYFQSFGNSFIDLLFLAITTLLSEPGYMLAGSIIFWCHSKKMGIRLMYVTLLCAYASIYAKSLFGLPRPPGYLQKIPENGFGFPSGHALVSSGFWGYVYGTSNNTRMLLASAGAILAVSISRIYLGVHYAGDVLGGIVFGLSIALILLVMESRVIRRFNQRRSKYLAVLLLPLVLTGASLFQSDFLKESIESGMVLAGIGIGYMLEEDYIRIDDPKNNRQGLKRLLSGLLVLSVVYVVSSLMFSDIGYLKYALLGFTSTFIAPWVFGRLDASSNSS